ncbi:MAG TPA: PilZ domain-containing protein [Nitrospira sp.]
MPRPLCPRCSREYVRRISRVGLGERLISLFYVYPFRCQLCGHRFQLLQWGVKYKKIEEDRREYDRMPVNFPATFAAGSVSGQGLIVDISIAGCSFHTEAHVGEGNILRMGLHVPNETHPVNVEAAVARSIQSGRVGVEFLQFENSERERLQRFIRQLILDRWS